VVERFTIDQVRLLVSQVLLEVAGPIYSVLFTFICCNDFVISKVHLVQLVNGGELLLYFVGVVGNL